MQEKIPCSVQVLTLNSAKTLEKCLESINDFAEIIVLDGNSTDNTIAIAERYTDKIYPQSGSNEKNIRITDFAAVRNQGLKRASYDWFLFIDSDEYLSREAVREIRAIVARGNGNAHFVYNLPRQYVLNGEAVASLRPTYQVRFFYVPAVTPFSKRVHERVNPKEGYSIGTLKHPEFVPLEDIKTLRLKWAYYLDIEQDKMKDITLRRFLIKTEANVIKCSKYLVKGILNKITHPRTSMPFAYEFYNAMYHLQIIQRLFLNLARNTFKRSTK